MPVRPTLPRLLVVAALLAVPLAPAAAQSLRGSRASVERAYDHARGRGLAFRQTPRGIQGAARRGAYVRLTGGAGYRLAGVSVPYVLPATRAAVAALGTRYRRACGERLVVTSAMRPAARRLRNGSAHSVHPTGMAVDLRAPQGGCRTWLRRALLGLERAGAVDATEERSPAHFHVVVFRSPAPARATPARRATTRVAAR